MGSRVFIIAEAGSNWRMGTPARDLRMAKTLIDAAAQAGADAVKFQTFRADTVYVKNAGTSSYLSKNGIRESIINIFQDLSMPYEMIPTLAKYCRKKRIEFMSSVFSEKDFQVVNPHVRRHKIASYEITYSRLLELAAKSGKPLILSTGASSYEDIDWAVTYFKRHGGKNCSLMQCTSKYPAPLHSLNLRAISAMSSRYRVPVGLSDHSRDPIIGPVAAVALGARVIEKHFTLNNDLPGPDHLFAITAGELKAMVKAVRDCEKVLGSGKKVVLPEERELKDYAQRAVQAIRDIDKGDLLREGGNVAVLRPGNQKRGMHPRFLKEAEGKKARRFIPEGQGISASDYRS